MRQCLWLAATAVLTLPMSLSAGPPAKTVDNFTLMDSTGKDW